MVPLDSSINSYISFNNHLSYFKKKKRVARDRRIKTKNKNNGCSSPLFFYTKYDLINLMNKMIKNIKGVFFDLDGTLVNTEQIQGLGLKKTFDFYNLDIPISEYYRFIGRGMTQIEKELKENFNLNIKDGELRNKRREIVMELFKETKLPLMPYAIESLEYFSRNYPLGICSTGEEEEVLLKLKNNNLDKYFDFIVTASDVKLGKPAPDIYLKAVEKINLRSDECITFEDTFSGLLAAKAAKIHCFSVPSGYEEHKDFSIADQKLESLKEGVELFKKYVD